MVTTSFHGDQACTTLDTTWVHDTSCGQWTIYPSHYYDVDTAVPGPGATCAPSGGAALGTVTAQGPGCP